MKLTEWLADRGLNQKEFALLIGANPSMVTRWIAGETRPSATYLRAIETATRRKVGYADFDWPARGNGTAS